MNKRLRLSMAVAMALAGSHAYALGLGQIEVKSALNQPLVAEIPVMVSSPGEADALSVRLAGPDAFTRVGLDRPTMQAANLNFEVATNSAGRTVIRITTPTSVADPFLSFLLEVDWGKGKMLREYTVLLDPPSMMPITGSAPATVAPVAEVEPMRSEPLLESPPQMQEPIFTPEPEPTPAPVVAAPAPVESAPVPVQPAPAAPMQDSAPTYSADSYGPVGSGDTLWTIAQGTRPDASVSMNQMMLALLRANPDAFIDNNINRLKKGAVLRIPGREEATTLAAADAAAQVREQMQSWSGMTATTLQPAEGTGAAPVTARRGKTATADSRLELTPPGGKGTAGATTSGATADGTGRELRAELARSKEEVGTLTQENVELKSRVGELEELQTESRRLIELKDSELAAAQKRLREAAAQAEQERVQADADAAALTAALPAVTPEVASEAAAEPDVTMPDATGDETVTAGLANADATADEISPMAAEEPAPTTAPMAMEESAPTVAPTPPPPAPAGDGWFGFNPWLVGGGAAILLGLVGVLLLARRSRASAKVSGPAASGLATPAAAFEPNQEEGELIEAISQHPDDLYLHLELLRHYFATDDAVGFEMASEAMYAQVRDEQDPTWQEARALGQQIAPEHPLFASSVASAEADDVDAYAEDADADHEAVRPFSSAAVTDEIEAVTEQRTHWDDAPATHANAFEADEALDYTLDEPAGDDDQPSFESAADDVAVEDFDHERFDAIDADAATTKLELARAYLDMGDAEGARGMLEEVLGEGTAAQRTEARQLLDGIA